MTKNDTLLLYKDLSGRTTYGTKIKHDNGIFTFDNDHCGIGMIDIETSPKIILSGCYYGDNIKPYLFPLSSMTEEQALELYKLFGIKLTDSIGWDYIKINEVTGITFFLRKGFDVETHLDKLIDWLLKNNFDFRGLIPMGLANDATGLNIY